MLSYNMLFIRMDVPTSVDRESVGLIGKPSMQILGDVIGLIVASPDVIIRIACQCRQQLHDFCVFPEIRVCLNEIAYERLFDAQRPKMRETGILGIVRRM